MVFISAISTVVKLVVVIEMVTESLTIKLHMLLIVGDPSQDSIHAN